MTNRGNYFYGVWLVLIYLILNGNSLLGQHLPEILKNNWTRTDSITRYQGEDLFFLINGGAEVYLEYGFEEVMATDYQRNESKIHVESYKMRNPLAAWGIFSLRKPSPAVFSEDLGWYATSGSYVMAAKSCIYLVLSGYGNIDELIALAAEILQNTPLIIEKQKDTSIAGDYQSGHDLVYIRGPLGLANVYRFGYGVFTKFDEGFCRRDERNQYEIRLKYLREDELREDFGKIPGWLEKSGQFNLSAQQENVYVFENSKNEKIRVEIQSPDEILIRIAPD